jgi:hypothetical protein
MEAAMTTMLATVLDYAAKGWAVFPCRPNTKEPATNRGFKDAITNPATIRRWWLAQPDYNVGIATGIASGVFVLDIDGAIGAAALRDLEAAHEALPATLCAVTSAGCHLWFRSTGPIQSSAGRVGPGLDVRGDGGYVLAPPSAHPDGPQYQWTNARAPAAAPEWLLKLARKPPPPPASISQRALGSLGSRPPTSDAYGSVALDAEIDALVNAPPGSRNHALNRASFCLHQLVAGGELDGAEVRHRLIEAATANGLISDPGDGPRSVEQTIMSGARAGLQHPRNRRGAA